MGGSGSTTPTGTDGLVQLSRASQPNATPFVSPLLGATLKITQYSWPAGGEHIAPMTIESDSRGRFSVNVPPGMYGVLPSRFPAESGITATPHGVEVQVGTGRVSIAVSYTDTLP